MLRPCLKRRTRGNGRRIVALGRKAVALTGTVTSETDLTDAVEKTEARLGPLSIGVNNAGIGGAGSRELAARNVAEAL